MGYCFYDIMFIDVVDDGWNCVVVGVYIGRVGSVVVIGVWCFCGSGGGSGSYI